MNPKNEPEFYTNNEFNGYFVFGIKILGKAEDEFLTDIHIRAENIPKELIIMKMKAQLKQFERGYFGDFDNSTPGQGLGE